MATTVILRKEDFSASANDLRVFEGLLDEMYEKNNDPKVYELDEVELVVTEIRKPK